MYTIFSATERENLHGHNFQVEAILEGNIGDDGLTSLSKALTSGALPKLTASRVSPGESGHHPGSSAPRSDLMTTATELVFVPLCKSGKTLQNDAKTGSVAAIDGED